MKPILQAAVVGLWLSGAPTAIADKLPASTQQTRNHTSNLVQNTLTQNQSIEQILQAEMMKIQQNREEFKTDKSIITEYKKNIENFKGLLHKSQNNINPKILKNIEKELREEELYLGAFEYFLSPENITTIGDKNAKKQITFLWQVHYTPTNNWEQKEEILFSQKIIKIYIDYFNHTNSIIAIEWPNYWDSMDDSLLSILQQYFMDQWYINTLWRVENQNDKDNIQMIIKNSEKINFLNKEVPKTDPRFIEYVVYNYFLDKNWTKEESINLLWSLLWSHFYRHKNVIGIDSHKKTINTHNFYQELNEISKEYSIFLTEAMKKKIDEWEQSHPEASPEEVEKYWQKTYNKLESIWYIIWMEKSENFDMIFWSFSTNNPQKDQKLLKKIKAFHNIVYSDREKWVVENIKKISHDNITVIFWESHKNNIETLIRKEVGQKAWKYYFISFGTNPENNKNLQDMYKRYFLIEWNSNSEDEGYKIKEDFFKNLWIPNDF